MFISRSFSHGSHSPMPPPRRFRLSESATRAGLLFSLSLLLVSGGYGLFLARVRGVDIQADGQREVEEFSLFEILPKESPFAASMGENWPFTPHAQLPPHPKYGRASDAQLRESVTNKVQKGKLSMADMFLPPSMRTKESDSDKGEK